MTASTRDQLAALLAAHRRSNIFDDGTGWAVRCQCGATWTRNSHEEVVRAHYAHLADVLAAAGVVAPDTATELRATIARVEALHFEVEGGWCNHCWTGPDAHGNGPSPEWPCATIRAALGGGA